MPHTMRVGIAMIELIFSIVVMSIAILSVPAIISVSTNSGTITTNQESIAEASSHLQIVMTALWDENDFNNSSPILVDNGAAGVEFPGMAGRSDQEANGSVLAPTSVANIGADLGSINDVDDYNNVTFNIVLFSDEDATTEEGDYLDSTAQMRTTVAYGVDIPANISDPFVGAPAVATDVKLISVTLSSANFANKNIVMSGFVCNIGAFTINNTGVDR